MEDTSQSLPKLPAKNNAKKTILINLIRHVDTQNRVQEEREMWRLRQLELQTRFEPVNSKSRDQLTRGRLLSDSLLEDEDREPNKRDRSPLSPIRSTHWTRQLMKAEECDPHRWGHSGYKELYPDEFQSTDEEDTTDEESTGDRRRSRKRKNITSRKKKHKGSPKWGHSGYKDLYPDEFMSTVKDDIEDEDVTSQKRKDKDRTVSRKKKKHKCSPKSKRKRTTSLYDRKSEDERRDKSKMKRHKRDKK